MFLKNKIIRVMVFGTFDGLHKGHLNFFKQAKNLSKKSFLIVSIARDNNVKRIKKEFPRLSEQERLSLVANCSLIDKAILSNKRNYLKHILKEHPDIIALGYDQKEYVKDLKNDLKKLKLKIKIIRLKSFYPKIYKNHLLRKK